jgi:hypothetical protein
MKSARFVAANETQLKTKQKTPPKPPGSRCTRRGGIWARETDVARPSRVQLDWWGLGWSSVLVVFDISADDLHDIRIIIFLSDNEPALGIVLANHLCLCLL